MSSCQKDEVQDLIKEKNDSFVSQAKSNNSNECGYIEELCVPCDNTIDPDPGDPVPPFYVYSRSTEGGITKYPVKVSPLFKGSSDFLVQINDEEYIFSDTKNPYIREQAINVQIPEKLNLLFKLDYENLLTGKYTIASLEEEIGTSVQEVKGKIEIDLTDATIENDEILGRAYDPCKGAYLAVLERYTTELNQPNPVFDLDVSTWMSNLDFFIQQYLELDFGRKVVQKKIGKTVA